VSDFDDAKLAAAEQQRDDAFDGSDSDGRYEQATAAQRRTLERDAAGSNRSNRSGRQLKRSKRSVESETSLASIDPRMFSVRVGDDD
jgi:hypothetical protein